MQVDQADLLKDLAEGEEFGSNDTEELCRATGHHGDGPGHQALYGSIGNRKAPMVEFLGYQ